MVDRQIDEILRTTTAQSHKHNAAIHKEYTRNYIQLKPARYPWIRSSRGARVLTVPQIVLVHIEGYSGSLPALMFHLYPDAQAVRSVRGGCSAMGPPPGGSRERPPSSFASDSRGASLGEVVASHGGKGPSTHNRLRWVMIELPGKV